MTVYFDNDGTYDESAIKAPLICCGGPIGFISDVTTEIVTVYLFNQYIHPVYMCGIRMDGSRDITSVNIEIPWCYQLSKYGSIPG